jgi:hypothetical protein
VKARKCARRDLVFAVALVLAAVLMANPPRESLVPCGSCGRGNEPDRTQCWYCQAAL